ncbi:APC family permease [Plesiomonas shigelloides]|nr:APC family permease [Plesiomonas shigelloides]
MRQLEQPSRNYPLSIAITAIVTVVVLILGTLTISAVLPHNDMNLVQGLLHTYDLIFSAMGCPWLGQILAAMLAIGVLGQVTVIVAGPSSGLLVVGREGMLPRWMQQVNRHGVQRNILLLQGAIVSVLSIVLVCLPSVQAAFQILGQLSGLLYLLMYILLFAAAIALRYRAPEVVRPYQIPGKSGDVVSRWRRILCHRCGLYPEFYAAVSNCGRQCGLVCRDFDRRRHWLCVCTVYFVRLAPSRVEYRGNNTKA